MGSVIFTLVPIAGAGETGAPNPVNYARPFEPPTRPAFILLPAGAVEPAGWLRDWCLAARDVEFIESTKPWAGGYLWTGDRRYLQAAVGWHDLLERVAMQPHGVPVSDEWYGPTGAFRGSETCDVAGYVWSQLSLLFVTGEGRMADRAERAFFNAGPATVSRDFKSHV